MYFDARLSVTIDGKNLTTVVGIKTSNDAAKVGSSCDLIVPLNAYFEYFNPDNLTTYLTAIRADAFPQGCPIEVIASYISEGVQMPILTVFRGFVFDFVLGMPTTIKCLDYIYFFNLGIFGDNRVSISNKAGTKIKNTGQGVHYSTIKFKDLLQQLVDFVNITISESTTGALPVELMPTFDMTLENLTFITMSPAAILEWFKTELGFNITFYDNKLYVNLASQTNGKIIVNTEVNCIGSRLQTTLQHSKKSAGKSPTLTAIRSAFQRIRLKCWFIREDGTRDSFEVGDQNGIQEEHFFYKVKREGNNYETLANAALLKAQQHHYRGDLELLLYPDCDLFFEVDYTDIRYPEKNGIYVILAVYFELDEKGFHRKIKLAWLDSNQFVNNQGQLVASS